MKRRKEIMELAGLLFTVVLEMLPGGVAERKLHEADGMQEQLVVTHSYFQTSNIIAFLCMAATILALIVCTVLLVSKERRDTLEKILLVCEVFAAVAAVCVLVQVPTVIAGVVAGLLVVCAVCAVFREKQSIHLEN